MEHSHTGFWIALACIIALVAIFLIWDPEKNKMRVVQLGGGSTIIICHFSKLLDGLYQVLFDSPRMMPGMITVLYLSTPGIHAQTYCIHESTVPGGKAVLDEHFFLENGRLQ